MIGHLLIFLFVGNLALGTWVFLSVKIFSKEFGDSATHALAWHILFYNLFISFILIRQYTDLNLSKADLFLWLPYSHHILYLLGTLPFFGMFFSMLRFYYAIFNCKVNRTIQNGFALFFAVLWICYGLYAWFLETGQTSVFLHFIYNWILDNDMIFEILLLILLLFKAQTVKTREEKRMIRAFSLLFLIRYLFIGILLPFPGGIRLLLFTGSLFYANLCPALWIRYWYRPFRQSRTEIHPNALTTFSASFGLTDREKEILNYVITGQSNKSIQQSLNISYHTVKNHLSNIFRKCRNKNRLELTRHFHEHTSV